MDTTMHSGPAEADGAVPADGTGALLQLRGIKREFTFGQTRVQALRGVDIDIDRGTFVAVWGPSGSGKSTLMNIVGLVDRPTAGTLRFGGRDTAEMDDNELTDHRNRTIGFVFQGFNLVPVLTAAENVELPLRIRGTPGAAARRRARELLAAVGLADFEHFLPDRLSGGQRQRVAIARALVGSPQLVVADEPTANLDTENGELIVSLMQQLNAATGVTFVLTTHDPRLLAHVRRRVLLKDGAIERDETAADATDVAMPAPETRHG